MKAIFVIPITILNLIKMSLNLKNTKKVTQQYFSAFII